MHLRGTPGPSGKALWGVLGAASRLPAPGRAEARPPLVRGRPSWFRAGFPLSLLAQGPAHHRGLWPARRACGSIRKGESQRAKAPPSFLLTSLGHFQLRQSIPRLVSGGCANARFKCFFKPQNENSDGNASENSPPPPPPPQLESRRDTGVPAAPAGLALSLCLLLQFSAPHRGHPRPSHHKPCSSRSR